MWTFNYFRNWFDKVKLCSIDVGRHVCSGLSFNPTNWRQLCTVSSDILTLWHIGQLNTKYSLVSRFLHFQVMIVPFLLTSYIIIAFWFVATGFLIRLIRDQILRYYGSSGRPFEISREGMEISKANIFKEKQEWEPNIYNGNTF